jgi:ketosteroid isomerase-like protein
MDRNGQREWEKGMKQLFALTALGAAACASAGGAPVDSRAAAEPVIAAELAFAARHQDVSVKQSFAEYAAADGVMATPEGFRNAREFIATWPDQDNKGFISWWPAFAGIARSGDLGFTTGPASFGGGKRYTNYFTVWKKQPDGSWKWMIDLGTQKGVKPESAPGSPVTIVPVSNLAPMDSGKAWAALQRVDRGLRDPALRNDPESLSRFYAPEAMLLGWRDAPLTGRAAVVDVNRARGPMEEEHKGGGVSAAGDFGWTYGFASWTEDSKPKRGPYLRVWQRRADGWQVLVENIHAF